MQDDRSVSGSSETPWAQSPPRLLKKRFLAAAMCCVVPGSGEWIIGDASRGVLFLAIFVVLSFSAVVARGLQNYWSMALILLSVIALWIGSTLNALGSRRSPIAVASRRWWLL